MKCLIVRFATVAALLIAGTAPGQIAYKNNGDKPQGLIEVYLDGTAVAGLYVLPGETMRIDNQEPISGAGYYEALQGKYYLIKLKHIAPVNFDGNLVFPSLHVDKVAWDHDGNLTEVSEIRPVLYLEAAKDIAIVSDLNHPKIANGNLYIKLDGHGDAEYWIKIQYGKIVGLGKHQAVPAASQAAFASALPPDHSIREVTPDDGVQFDAQYTGDEEIGEFGAITVTGEVKKFTLVKSGKEYDVELAKGALVNGRLDTKQFGLLIVKNVGGYWRFYATEEQIKKMQSFLRSQPD